MKKQIFLAALGAIALGISAFSASTIKAKEIVIRIGSGHPPTVVYAGLMKNYFHELFYSGCPPLKGTRQGGAFDAAPLDFVVSHLAKWNKTHNGYHIFFS